MKELWDEYAALAIVLSVGTLVLKWMRKAYRISDRKRAIRIVRRVRGTLWALTAALFIVAVVAKSPFLGFTVLACLVYGGNTYHTEAWIYQFMRWDQEFGLIAKKNEPE